MVTHEIQGLVDYQDCPVHHRSDEQDESQHGQNKAIHGTTLTRELGQKQLGLEQIEEVKIALDRGAYAWHYHCPWLRH